MIAQVAATSRSLELREQSTHLDEPPLTSFCLSAGAFDAIIDLLLAQHLPHPAAKLAAMLSSV